MENTSLKYVAGTDGTIRFTLTNSLGEPVSLIGCNIVFKLGLLNNSTSLISKDCTLENGNICKVELTHTDTKNLDSGVYDIMLIITDGVGKISSTGRKRISTESIIN